MPELNMMGNLDFCFNHGGVHIEMPEGQSVEQRLPEYTWVWSWIDAPHRDQMGFRLCAECAASWQQQFDSGNHPAGATYELKKDGYVAGAFDGGTIVCEPVGVSPQDMAKLLDTMRVAVQESGFNVMLRVELGKERLFVNGEEEFTVRPDGVAMRRACTSWLEIG